MAEFTRPATWQDVRCVAEYLNEAGVEYALIGGYALALHGLSRLTQDIDVLVDPAPDNSRRWIAALAKLPDSATKALAADPDVFANRQQYAIRVNDEITIDVLPAAAGHDWSELRGHIMVAEIDGVPVKVLNLEGLLKTKQVPRPKDQADARLIEQALDALKRRS